MTQEPVEVIKATGRQRAVSSLTLAFSPDPVMRWGLPCAERSPRSGPQIADAFGGTAGDHGTAHTPGRLCGRPAVAAPWRRTRRGDRDLVISRKVPNRPSKAGASTGWESVPRPRPQLADRSSMRG